MDSTQITKPEKKYFSTREVIDFLKEFAGMTVSRSTVFKWSMRGKIPCKKSPTGRLLFPVKDVKEWIDGCSLEQNAKEDA